MNKSDLELEAPDILWKSCMERSNFIPELKEKIAPLSINEREDVERYMKEYARSNNVSDWKQYFSISPKLSIYKSGYGLLTHYNFYNSKSSSLDKMNEKLLESLLKG